MNECESERAKQSDTADFPVWSCSSREKVQIFSTGKKWIYSTVTPSKPVFLIDYIEVGVVNKLKKVQHNNIIKFSVTFIQ